MEAVSGLDLDEFFNDWVYGIGNCTYNVAWGVQGRTISLQLTQNSATGTGFVTHFDTPVPIKILGSGVDTTVVIFDRNGTIATAGGRATATTVSNVLRIELSFVPTGIQIDPEAKSLASAGTVSFSGTLSIEELQLSGQKTDDYNQVKLAVPRGSNPGATYIMEYSADGSRFTTIGNLSSSGSNATNDLFEFRHYDRRSINYYRVKRREANGEWKFSNVVKITVDRKNRLVVHGNPVANGRLNLSLPDETGGGELRIGNASGKTLLTQNVAAGITQLRNIDISHFNAGYYVVWFQTRDGRLLAEKLVVN
jgi:hypothetical protein